MQYVYIRMSVEGFVREKKGIWRSTHRERECVCVCGWVGDYELTRGNEKNEWSHVPLPEGERFSRAILPSSLIILHMLPPKHAYAYHQSNRWLPLSG